MQLRSVKDMKVAGKTVLVRTGFDVSVDKGKIDDDSRIAESIPTLDYLAQKNAKILIVSHLGRPQGWEKKFSLEPVAQKLAELWDRKFVVVAEDSAKLPEYGIPHLYFFQHNLEETDLKPLISQMREQDAAVLENLRFYSGETTNAPGFVRKLAGLADAYVNEAFSVCHRVHASVVGLAQVLPSAAGLGLMKEVAALTKVISRPKKPVVVMMGGVKLSDKAEALENLIKFSDYVLLGGGLANMMLKIRGFEIGKSVYEEGKQDKLGRQLWRNYKDKIVLPVDVVVSRSRDGEPECVKIDKIKSSQMILDIGPETIRLYSGYLKKGKTLIWGGPVGYFENKTFSHGTFALAWLFASRSAMPAVYGVAGGGQTSEVIKRLGLRADIDYLSTGGGAMLDMLAGKSLPGLKVLQK
jgi:3-phosphoglycerate kinase